jgi:hypothetical protein
MQAHYGIGSYYTKENADYSKDFYDNNMVCISSSNPERLYFKGLFENIKKNDIVFLKSIKRKRRRLIVRAIGEVLRDDIDNNDYGYKRDVKWLTPFNEDGLIEIKIIRDGGSQRTGRIFQEFNPNIIGEIEEIIKKYRRD